MTKLSQCSDFFKLVLVLLLMRKSANYRLHKTTASQKTCKCNVGSRLNKSFPQFLSFANREKVKRFFVNKLRLYLKQTKSFFTNYIKTTSGAKGQHL